MRWKEDIAALGALFRSTINYDVGVLGNPSKISVADFKIEVSPPKFLLTIPVISDDRIFHKSIVFISDQFRIKISQLTKFNPS